MATSTLPTTATGTRLASFLAGLFGNRRKLQDFLADAKSAMDAAGLTEKERGYLTDQNFTDLCDYVWEAGDMPAPDPATGSGGTGGTGGTGSGGSGGD